MTSYLTSFLWVVTGTYLFFFRKQLNTSVLGTSVGGIFIFCYKNTTVPARTRTIAFALETHHSADSSPGVKDRYRDIFKMQSSISFISLHITFTLLVFSGR